MRLPPQATLFVGRTRETEALRSALGNPHIRLLTITGPPGVGKTRLAIEVAHSLVSGFEHGIHFVNLAPLQDANMVLTAIAQSLRLHPVRHARSGTAASAATHLEQYLRNKHALLILDNFEHVIPASVSISNLLAACAHIRVVVTSRERLRISWEHTYPLEPLPHPIMSADIGAVTTQPAVALLLDRMRAVLPRFEITSTNARAAVDICRQLDGLPLAIELAAGQIRTLSLKELATHLASRFDILKSGSPDSPVRHRSLHDSIDWSYQLLDERERIAFRRLAVFRGGFSLKGAQAVLRLTSHRSLLDDITVLVEKNLISAVRGTTDESRYVILESLREFAMRKLDASKESVDVQASHAAYFLKLAEEADRACNGPDQALWLEMIETELDNFRAALQWGLDHDPAAALRIAVGLQWFWEGRGHLVESHRWYEAALAAHTPNVAQTLRAKALAADGLILWYLSIEDSIRVSTEGLRIAENSADYQTAAFCLRNLGLCALEQGEYSQAEAHYAARLSLHERYGPTWAIGNTLTHMAALARIQGDLDRATDLAEKNLSMSRALGNKRVIALGLATLGRIALHRGHLSRAADFLEESTSINRELGAVPRVARTLNSLGLVALNQGDLRRARELAAESMRLDGQIGCRSGIAETLRELGVPLVERHDPPRAARWWGFAHAVREEVGILAYPIDKPKADQLYKTLRQRLGETGFDYLWHAGRLLSVEEVLREVEAVFGPVQDSGKGPAAMLSGRELQVASLVAEGLSNRAIASRLHIGVRTVETHVENIMNKLGVHTRAEVAAWVVKQTP